MLETITRFDFEEYTYKDTVLTASLAVAGFVALFLGLNWIQTNIVGQTQVVAIFFAFLVLAGFAYGANILKRAVPRTRWLPLGMVGVGYNLKATLAFALIGLGLGYFLVTQQLSVALPLDISFNQPEFSMDFVYKVVMSPIIEELFRAVTLITTALLVFRPTKNWLLSLLLGLIISSVVFGAFHWLAYQQEFAFIGAAIIFGLLAGMLMLVSKSIVPAMALHWTNNALIYSNGDPTQIVVAAGLTIALLLVLVFKRR